MAETLTTSRYVLPGAYLGRIYRPNAGTLSGQPRQPCYVGKGNRLATALNISITRSYRTGTTLSVPVTAPHVATLTSLADGDQTAATLYTQAGEVIPATKWSFQKSTPSLEGYDQVLMLPEVFNITSTYLLDYQSIDRTVTDPIPFDDLRQMVRVGDYSDQDLYQELVDYYIVTEKTDPVADSGNGNTTTSILSPPVQTAGTGTATMTTTSPTSYTGNYNRHYRLEVTAVGGGPDFDFEITISSGGNGGNSMPWNHPTGTNVTKRTFNVATTGDFDIDVQAGLASLGVSVNINTTQNYLVGDVWELNAYGPALCELDPAYDNTNQYAEVGAVAADSGNTGTGTITLNPSTDYTGSSNAQYKFECAAVAGTSPTRTATIDWQRVGPDGTAEGSISLVEATPATLTNITVERGIKVDCAFGGTHFVAALPGAAGDVFTTNALAPRLMYTGKDDRTYTIKTTAAVNSQSSPITGGNQGNQEFIVTGDQTAWIEVGDTVRVTGSTGNDGFYTVATAVLIGTDTTVTVNEAIPSATFDGTLEFGFGYVNVFWSTDTPEGRYGTETLIKSDEAVGLADSVTFYMRNSDSLAYAAATNQRNTVDDLFTFTMTNSDYISWNLVSQVTETIDDADLRDDVTGAITGASGGGPGTKYIILGDTPTEAPSRVWTATADLTLATTPPYVAGSGAYWIEDTPYIFFPTAPTEDISVTYVHKAEEPDPGQTYFVTAYYLRPMSMYNTPIRLLSPDEITENLGPQTVNNDLMTMATIAIEDCNAFAVWVVQVYDTDQDGVYTTLDFNTAIEATETKSDITDLIVLQHFDSLSKAKTSTIRMNDPFERKERLCWVGTPVGTEIGDIDTVDTLVYLAKRTLQVYGDSPAHGAFILVGNTVCERTILLPDGTQTTVTYDGSFIAGAVAALVASYSDPAETILRKDQPGFDRIGGTTIDTKYEEKQLILLGDAGVIALNDLGANVYQWVEDITVDTTANDTIQINVMTQKQFVTKEIWTSMDRALISVVPPSRQAGIAIVKNFLVEKLRSIESRGIIAPWTDSSGNDRPLDPNSDVEVFLDESVTTLYHYKYWFNGRYPIKQLFGLYSVDTRAFGVAQ